MFEFTAIKLNGNFCALSHINDVAARLHHQSVTSLFLSFFFFFEIFGQLDNFSFQNIFLKKALKSFLEKGIMM